MTINWDKTSLKDFFFKKDSSSTFFFFSHQLKHHHSLNCIIISSDFYSCNQVLKVFFFFFCLFCFFIWVWIQEISIRFFEKKIKKGRRDEKRNKNKPMISWILKRLRKKKKMEPRGTSHLGWKKKKKNSNHDEDDLKKFNDFLLFFHAEYSWSLAGYLSTYQKVSSIFFFFFFERFNFM